MPCSFNDIHGYFDVHYLEMLTYRFIIDFKVYCLYIVKQLNALWSEAIQICKLH